MVQLHKYLGHTPYIEGEYPAGRYWPHFTDTRHVCVPPLLTAAPRTYLYQARCRGDHAVRRPQQHTRTAASDDVFICQT